MLRSLMLGDCDYYFSPYIFGVQQGMTSLGHWHTQVNLRAGFDTIAQRIADVQPHILWTHMLLWAPQGSPPLPQLVSLMEREARRGCKIVIHDGDYKDRTRHPHDISGWCSLALCNHAFDRSAWRAPVMRWPYFAFDQPRFVRPRAIVDKLFFAGSIDASSVYGSRTRLIEETVRAGVPMEVSRDGNTLFRTTEIASSMRAVLGFGRPDVEGWIDTRVFQYPGAGAILIHDHAPQLEPWRHFAPYVSGSASSVAETFERLRAMPADEQIEMRHRAWAYVQRHHSATARVRQVLDQLFGDWQ